MAKDIEYKQESSPLFTVDGIPEGVSEIKLTFHPEKIISTSIKSSKEVAHFIRSLYEDGEIELQEHFIVLYLNQANHILGYYRHTIGGITGVVVDVRLIMAAALKSASTAIILVHNHPSSLVKPSESDKQLTKKIQEAGNLLDIAVLDHLIITKDSHFSFADNDLMELETIRNITPVSKPDDRKKFVHAMREEFLKRVRHNKRSVEKLARSFGITDKTEVKELIELAIVFNARGIATAKGGDIKAKFDQLVDLYRHQVNLSHRTSMSVMLQQYSTPAPIAYLAGVFVKADQGVSVFEPSAGNGLLTIAAPPENVVVNEIGDLRRANLEKQGYKEVLKKDATKPFRHFDRYFDAVLTNPPFGTLDEVVKYDTFPIRALDHLMTLRALDTMKDNGRAAIIIGNHTRWDSKGRIQSGKNRIFFNYLYSRYNILDVINIDGKLYSRQGTSFNVRLILVDGRKPEPGGAAPLKDKEHDKVVRNFEALYERIMDAMNTDSLIFKARALKLKLALLAFDELGAPYVPASESCVILDTQVPDSMEFEAHSAVGRIKQAVGGSMDEFVRERLDYATNQELCKALSAEQIDAVGMAIYNIEARSQGMIIGDQTGIGKGRVAASMIRYGVLHGYKPIFLTEKANLFSDIYRDLLAIGAGELVPFIVNNRESKTDIKDENGNIIHQALSPTEQKTVIEDKKIPGRYDFVIATYSQFNSPEKKPQKPAFLSAIAADNLMVMDESHNSSGSSNTGEFLQAVIAGTAGVTFLSATFAKRPDNMPVYAMKTAISEANMTRDDLVEAIKKGGVALQEVLASQLVAEGQMIRRERSFEDVEVNYITMTEKVQEHQAVSDNITELLREIIGFQTSHIDKQVEELDDIAKSEGKEIEIKEGTSQAGVDNIPYFSKVFNVINQMLFSLKAERVAEKAIERLKEGKKPVIAFASTMGSFVEQIENDNGLPVADGDIIKADFAEVLQRGLDGIMRYSETDVDGQKIHKKFEVSNLPPEAQADYQLISERIREASTGITISPIDVILQKLKKAGYSVAEVTGRKYELQVNLKTGMGLVQTRKKVNTNDAFREFNNNEIDVLLINQSGSTGASAHAIPTDKVPESEVKQRVMIVLQAELNINTEVQKRGRINRTGQVHQPVYDYMISAIPAEQRLMMMLQKKLKSLDANTTSNQKQSTSIFDVLDFLNKYGDRVIIEYLQENEDINQLIGDPLRLKETNNPEPEGASHKVSGRVAVLSTKMQKDFYQEITARYQDYVEYLKQTGDYDLEVEALNLEAETIKSRIIKVGKGGESAFGEDSILKTVKTNVLKKPFTSNELDNLIKEALQGQEAQTLQEQLIEKFRAFTENKLQEEIRKQEEKYKQLIAGIPQEKKLLKIMQKEGGVAYERAQSERKEELEEARRKAIDKMENQIEFRKDHLDRIFRFFTIGKKIKYPVETFDGGAISLFAVSLGFAIDEKKKNPYTPSAVRLRLAIAGSQKYIAIPASFSKDINAIMGVSSGIGSQSIEDTLAEWETTIQNNNIDRTTRHIITGNLLQAFSDFKGKLVSYTTHDNQIKKGILMPEYWEPQKATKDRVIVPITKAKVFIRSLSTGNAIHTNNRISIFRQPDNFKIVVPSSKKQGGAVFLDQDILGLVNSNNFQKVGDKMVAELNIEKIDSLLDLLQEKYSASVSLTSEEFQSIQGEGTPLRSKTLKMLPPTKKKVRRLTRPANALKLKAKALKLKLELLKLAA